MTKISNSQRKFGRVCLTIQGLLLWTAVIFMLLMNARALAQNNKSSGGRNNEPAALPPTWVIPKEKPNTKKAGNLANLPNLHDSSDRPWHGPRFALGVGLNLPEILPFEGWLFLGRYAGLRFFFTPELPLKIRIEMPSDVVSAEKDKGIGVATPDFTINMKAHYGPHYGLEALAFPFGGSFFVGAGASYRKLRITGSAKSPILICSLIEAAKDPPCNDPEASIRTETQLGIRADVTTSAILMRSSFGWFWHVGSNAYLMFNAGLTKPTHIRRSATIEASVDSPGDDDAISGALEEVKREREADLRDKALKEISPFEEKMLPILGLATGVRF